MTLVYNEKAKFKGQPQFHALIAGVSYYDYLPGNIGGTVTPYASNLEQLSSPAVSAYEIYKWLEANASLLPANLTTIRLLISPSSAEIHKFPVLNKLTKECTYDKFSTEAKAWRNDARDYSDGRDNSEDYTFFYYCGHGFQRNPRDSVITFQDFGEPDFPPEDRMVDVDNIYYGMAPPSDPTMRVAQNQIYLIDACRVKAGFIKNLQINNARSVFTPEQGQDNRSSPVFFGSISGAEAVGIKAEKSLFCEAVIKCLEGGGGDHLPDRYNVPCWQVRSSNLSTGLNYELEILNKIHNKKQACVPGGQDGGIILAYLKSVPEFDVNLEIYPDHALPHTDLNLFDLEQKAHVPLPVPLALSQNLKVRAGYFKIDAKVKNPPRPPYKDMKTLCAT